MIHRECGVLKTSYEADMALYPLPIARWTVAVLAVIFFLLIPLAALPVAWSVVGVPRPRTRGRDRARRRVISPGTRT